VEVRYILLLPPCTEEILFSTVITRSLIKDVEHSEVYAALPEGYEWIIENNPYISGQLIYDKNPSKNLKEFKKIEADYLIDLTGGKNGYWFKNRLKVMDFTLNHRILAEIRSEQKLSNALKKYRSHAFKVLDVFDLRDDEKGLDLFYGHNKAFIERAIPESFLDGYAVIDIPGEIKEGTDINESLSGLISRIERPVVLCGDEQWKDTGEEVMRRTGCTILSTCGDFSDQEKVFTRAGAKVLVDIEPRKEIWAMVFDKPHFYIDISAGPDNWRKEIEAIRKIINQR
jgi:hypothetical protein